MEQAACAIGRLGADAPWVGFAPGLDDGYDIVIGPRDGSTLTLAADPTALLALAIAYFEDALDEPPEELAATHGDIGALVRHLAEHEPSPPVRRLLREAVDAIDDGLAADVVIGRLSSAFRAHDATSEPVELLRRLSAMGADNRPPV